MDSINSLKFGDQFIDLKVLPEYKRIKVDMVELEPEFLPIYLQSTDFTMTSAANMFAMYSAVKYVVANQIPGDIVECGVWRGGICMVAALTLAALEAANRSIYLYDTFSGMPEPTEKDQPIALGKYVTPKPALELWQENQQPDHNSWCYASLEDVQQNVLQTGYPAEQFVFVKGKVEDTIPDQIPDSISILRLDTDWFESTYHELVHLYPLLSPGGVIILDDYGFWQGQKEAADRYFAEHNIHPLLQRIDSNARMAIKLP